MLKCPSKRREAAAQEAAAKEASLAPATQSTSADSAKSDQSPQHEAVNDGFAEVNDEGELIEASSNGLTAYVRAGLGNLASDSASMTKAAVMSAAAALSRISLRRQSPNSAQANPHQDYIAQQTGRWSSKSPQAKKQEMGTASKQFHNVMKNAGLESVDESEAPLPEMLGVPSAPAPAPALGTSPEQIQSCRATANEACQQFHAVMKNAGLEAEDEEIVSIPQLLGCPAECPQPRSDTETQAHQQPDPKAEGGEGTSTKSPLGFSTASNPSEPPMNPARSSQDQIRGQEASHHSACKQFHEVMKNAGLEAADEEVIPIPELLGCSNQSPAPQASAAATPSANAPEPSKSLDLQNAISISSSQADSAEKRRVQGSLDLPTAEASQVMEALEHPSIIDGVALEELRAAGMQLLCHLCIHQSILHVCCYD